MLAFFQNILDDLLFKFRVSNGTIVLNYAYNHNKLYEENFDWVKENCRGCYKPMMGWRHYQQHVEVQRLRIDFYDLI